MGWFFRQPLVPLFIEVVGTFVFLTIAVVMLTERLRGRVRERFQRSFEQAAYYGTQSGSPTPSTSSLTAVGAWSEYQRPPRRCRARWPRWRCCSAAHSSIRADAHRAGPLMRDYARVVADKEWPQQRKAKHPSAAKEPVRAGLWAWATSSPRTCPTR